MDLPTAIGTLPEAYAALLRLRLAGADDALIAAALALDVEAVPALEQVANAKLIALLDSATSDR